MTRASVRNVHHRRETCRGCGSRALDVFLELGPQPLANALPASPADFEAEGFYPLDVAFCRDCTLVQLVDVIDPEVLFGHYLYVTGTSTSMVDHWRGYAAAVVSGLRLGKDDLVVEVASNDGSLLAQFAPHGVRTLGIEPARNIAAMARERGIDTINRFFSAAVAAEVRAERGGAAVAIANNVLAHVDEPVDFLRGMRELVEPAGTVVVEAPYAIELVKKIEYDTIYHEHLSYFSVTALLGIYERAGLAITHVDRVPVHGGSLRIWARPRATGAVPDASVLELAAAERAEGYGDAALYRRFAAAVQENRAQLNALVDGLLARGETVAAYGCPAKGNTLLNYCRLGTDRIAFTVDKSPLKVGRFTPGMHLPVLPVDELRRRRPDHTLILPWNLAAEIHAQEAAYREAGGRFLVPIPAPREL
jgi:SAM-dependent methyltransferase